MKHNGFTAVINERDLSSVVAGSGGCLYSMSERLEDVTVPDVCGYPEYEGRRGKWPPDVVRGIQ
jgi:hypothetical protein